MSDPIVSEDFDGLRIIDITMIFDAAAIYNELPRSTNPKSPTGVPHGKKETDYVYMTAAKEIAEGIGSADLVIYARPSEQIRWRTRSLSDNTGFSVGLMHVKHHTGQFVVEDIRGKTYTQSLIVYDSESQKPVIVRDYANSFIRCDVKNTGTEHYYVYFNLMRANPITGAIEILGYYYWDPAIHCKELLPPPPQQ